MMSYAASATYRAQNEALTWSIGETSYNDLHNSELRWLDLGRAFKTKFTFALLLLYTGEAKWGRFLYVCGLFALRAFTLLEWHLKAVRTGLFAGLVLTASFMHFFCSWNANNYLKILPYKSYLVYLQSKQFNYGTDKSCSYTPDFREERLLFREPFGGVWYTGWRPYRNQEKYASARQYGGWKRPNDETGTNCGVPSYPRNTLNRCYIAVYGRCDALFP